MCEGDGSMLSQPTIEESEPPPKQAWVTALELKKKIDDGEALKRTAVKFALNDYRHYNPEVNRNLILILRYTELLTIQAMKISNCQLHL